MRFSLSTSNKSNYSKFSNSWFPPNFRFQLVYSPHFSGFEFHLVLYSWSQFQFFFFDYLHTKHRLSIHGKILFNFSFHHFPILSRFSFFKWWELWVFNYQILIIKTGFLLFLVNLLFWVRFLWVFSATKQSVSLLVYFCCLIHGYAILRQIKKRNKQSLCFVGCFFELACIFFTHKIHQFLNFFPAVITVQFLWVYVIILMASSDLFCHLPPLL